MATQRLANYLKTYRKRSGLSQREVAFLLGLKRADRLSRYEKRRQLPTLRIALACEAIFKAPTNDLFGGAVDSTEREVELRIQVLAAKLQTELRQGKKKRLAARKLSWLAANHGRPSSFE